MASTYYLSDDAWSTWTTVDTGTVSSTSVWSYWTSSNTGTSTSSSDKIVWANWTSSPTAASTTSTITYDGWTTWVKDVEILKETREQERARRAQAEINRLEIERKTKEVEDARKQAELTAQELLKDLITEEEMQVYLKTGRVLVKGKKNDYLLVSGYQADVIKLEKGKVVSLKDHKGKVKGKSYCVHPADQHKLPVTDKVIAMKIALESHEDHVMKLANPRSDCEVDLAVGI